MFYRAHNIVFFSRYEIIPAFHRFGAKANPPGESALDCHDGDNDEGEEEEKEKSGSTVNEVPGCQGKQVRLLKDIQVDVKRLRESLLFYTAK